MVKVSHNPQGLQQPVLISGIQTDSPMVKLVIIILMTTFMVLLSWQGHCESSPGSFGECQLSARWTLILKSSQPTWPVSPLVGCYRPHPPSPIIIITPPKSWYLFYRPMDGGRLSQP